MDSKDSETLSLKDELRKINLYLCEAEEKIKDYEVQRKSLLERNAPMTSFEIEGLKGVIATLSRELAKVRTPLGEKSSSAMRTPKKKNISYRKPDKKIFGCTTTTTLRGTRRLEVLTLMSTTPRVFLFLL